MALNQQITIHRGAAYELAVDLQLEDETPLDPIGGTLRFHIAPSVDAAPVLILANADIPREEVSGGRWEAVITLSDAQTATLSPGTYYMELAFTDVQGRSSVLFYGACAVRNAQLPRMP